MCPRFAKRAISRRGKGEYSSSEIYRDENCKHTLIQVSYDHPSYERNFKQ